MSTTPDGLDTLDLEGGPSTVLRPERQPLLGYVALSVFGHGAVLVGALLFAVVGRACVPSKPVVDLDRQIEVSMVVLPKAKTKMPDRAARAPVPKGEPEPKPAPTPVPPPAKVSDLVVHTEKPEPKPEGVTTDQRRDELMAELERQRLLEELMNAPEGTVDRDATDPNSDSDVAIQALGNASRGDPEFARYVAEVQKIFMLHFKPLPAITQANPGLSTTLLIRVDEAGRITAWEVSTPSGIAAFDAAAERAVQEVGTIPPPPEKYRPLAAEGYTVRLRAP